MSNRFSKVVVLAVSVTLGSCYIWYMSEKGNPSAMPAENVEEKQVQTQTPQSNLTVTDEEVNLVRESMMKSSKSGLIMNDDQIRAMLETEKKNAANSLMHSSKSLRAFSFEEIKQAVEEPPTSLLPSTKMAPAFDSEDVKVTRDQIMKKLEQRANEKK